MVESSLACPTSDELQRFLLGWRPADPDEAARLDKHVTACPRCNERAESLECDALVDQLRAGIGPLVPPDEAVRQLIDQCKHLHQSTPHATKTLVDVALPEQVGLYDVLGVLRQGGMGIVFKARHRQLNRLTALKMIANPLADRELIERFRIKAEAEREAALARSRDALADAPKHPNSLHTQAQ